MTCFSSKTQLIEEHSFLKEIKVKKSCFQDCFISAKVVVYGATQDTF